MYWHYKGQCSSEITKKLDLTFNEQRIVIADNTD